MIYFISYDIADSKRRREVSKILENFGIRIQYSFFECEMEKSQLKKLKNEILKIIQKKEKRRLVLFRHINTLKIFLIHQGLGRFLPFYFLCISCHYT